MELWHFFGGIIAGKEAMGMGDIKFMAPIRIGLKKILDITLLAFLLSSIIAIGIIIYRKKKKIDDEYIPFGPFLVIGIALMLFLPSGTIVDGFMVFCNMISQNILLLIGK